MKGTLSSGVGRRHRSAVPFDDQPGPRRRSRWRPSPRGRNRAVLAGITRTIYGTPASGEPVHIELTLEGFTLGIATMEAAKEHHSLRPGGEGHWIEIVLWTDDTHAALNALVAKGAPLLSPAHDFLDGKLRAAWIADPDGNPIQLVQRRH
ncbi:MAG TPA: VOC family protein [Acidobacteriaceae bacterium]